VGWGKKSPLLKKKTKCFHTSCKCIRLSKSEGRQKWGWQEDGGSPDGFHGDDSNGYSRYSDCLVCVCDAGNESGKGEFFWGVEEDPGQFNKICFPNPPPFLPLSSYRKMREVQDETCNRGRQLLCMEEFPALSTGRSS
jgi:hypothetical protein